MIIRSTTDPMTGHDIADPANHPCVFMGDGDNGVEVYFESEESRREFLAMDADDDHRIALAGDDSEDYVAEG